MKLVLLGAPGSGKGTQAQMMVQQLNISHLSTGEMLRGSIVMKHPIGLSVQSVMESGGLVPDDIVVSIVVDRIANGIPRCGYVLDGFPRTLAQAVAFDSALQLLGSELDHVIELAVQSDALVERILNRAAEAHARHQTKRADDIPEVLKSRMLAYASQTAPLRDYYSAQGKLRSVDGMQDPILVSRAIKDVIGM
jgi:adenylate kinase